MRLNDLKHTSKVVQNVLKDTNQGLEVALSKPRSQSHWESMEGAQCEGLCLKPCNLDELELFAVEEWAKIPQEPCQPT